MINCALSQVLVTTNPAALAIAKNDPIALQGTAFHFGNCNFIAFNAPCPFFEWYMRLDVFELISP